MEAQPWEHVHFLSLSLPIRRPLTLDWSMMFIPTLRTMVEDLSDADQNLTGGAIVGFSRQISPKLKLGPGSDITQLEDNPSFFPVIVVDWDLSDQWRLSTGRGAGASQGPGLTLSYDWSTRGISCFSGRYERFRFRTERQGRQLMVSVKTKVIHLFNGCLCHASQCQTQPIYWRPFWRVSQCGRWLRPSDFRTQLRFRAVDWF